MGNPRYIKVAEQIKVIVAEMLDRRIKDPRLGLRHPHRRAAHRRRAGGDRLLHRAG
jgi:hypothetical protein